MKTLKKLILGTVQMGLPYGIRNGGNLSYKDSETILKRAFESGIRELDTAEAYGVAHNVIGKFHELNPEKQFNIITKLPKEINEDIESRISQYITELRVDKLEGIMFHAYDTLRQNPEILDMLVKLREQNLINKIGVSIYTNKEFESILHFDKVDLIQLPYNLLDNKNIRGELIESAKEKGKIIHTRSAFLQGLFFMNPSDKNKIVESLKEELLVLNDIAREENLTIASLALNYCLQNRSIDKVLIGVDNIDQLEQNLSISEQMITDESMERINNIFIKNKNFLNPALWN